MATTPEALARQSIDAALVAAGWEVQDVAAVNLYGAQGVAVREFALPGYGEADYLLFVDGQAVGAVEAKKEGETLRGVETQTAKYAEGLPGWRESCKEVSVFTRFIPNVERRPRRTEVLWINY